MTLTTAPLVIADISGYTRHLGGVEPDHSRDVLADLIGLIADQLSGVLSIAKLEGDAVFAVGQRVLMLVMRRRMSPVLRENFDALVSFANSQPDG